MSFKGGFLLKPTETKTQNLATLLLQGTQAIEEKKERLNKVAGELADKTNKSVNIPITGPADYQVLTTRVSSAIRDAQSKAYQDFLSRRISMDQYSQLSSKLNSQAVMYSKNGELASKQNEDIAKGIEEGKLSPVNQVLKYGLFSASSRTDNKESVMDVFINEFGDVVISQSYLEPQLDGTTITKTKQSPLNDRFSHATGSLSPYRSVDVTKDVDQFKKNIANRKLANLVSNPIIENGQTVGYENVVTIDQSQDPLVRRALSTAIGAYTDEDLVDVLFTQIGAKPDVDPTYKPIKQEVINSRFGENLLDESGNPITISPEDMKMNTADDGITIELTDKQRDIAKSFIRGQYEASLGLESKITVDRQPVKEEEVDVKDIDFSVSPLDSNNNLLSKAIEAQSTYNRIIGNDKDTKGGVVKQPQLQDQELQELLTEISGGEKGIKNKVVGLNIPTKLSNQIIKLDVKSHTGQKIKSVSQILSVKRGNKLDFLIIGPSDLADIRQQSMAGNEVVAVRTEFDPEAISPPLSDTQVSRLYTDLWDNNTTFKKLAEARGYNKSARDSSGKSDYRLALSFIISDYAEQ